MSTPPVTSLQLTEDQVLFLITFMNQNSDLLPPQRRNLPEVLARQRNTSSRSSYNLRLQDLEHRERELRLRERDLEHRLTEVNRNEKDLNARDSPAVGGRNSPLVDDSPPSISHSTPPQSRGFNEASDRDPRELNRAEKLWGDPHAAAAAEHDDDDDEGTLVESDDFTDKWFQTQAEDLGDVEDWLALQVEALSIPPVVSP
ncbi:hypothetical protein EV361DRAFT_955078 [Lentinula raphanica]|nr:hypothetical protein EV361DRAFT_955078 [Lentinula raphanica]